MLPRVSASTVYWMNVSTVALFYRSRGRPASPGRPPFVIVRRPSADELVVAVRLDLEDVELRVQRVVGLRRPFERTTENPVLDGHLLEVLEHELPSHRAVALRTRELDRVHGDLRSAVARRAEGTHCLARIVLLPAGDDRSVRRDPRDVRGERRHVRPRSLELRRGVRPVSAEDLRLLALLQQLLRERLRVARLLGRVEDDVGVVRDLRHVRSEEDTYELQSHVN